MIQREMVSFWRPHLLYLKATPHSSLYVEVDAVEGSEPSDFEIAQLARFLKRYCDKPDGIEIVRDPVIPLASARGESEESLALRYLSGPPPELIERRPAFLYVLFYDSGECMGERNNKDVEPRKPHVSLLPYPAAVFIDRHYDPWGHEMWDIFAKHEVGHLLGLARDISHGDGMHCRDTACLMSKKARIRFFRWLVGRERPKDQHDLCERCRQEIERYGALAPDPNLYFDGPVLVRSERDYYVLALPAFVELYVGSPADLSRRQILADAQRVAELLREGDVWVYYRDGTAGKGGAEVVKRALESAAGDPYDLVRRIAEREKAGSLQAEAVEQPVSR
jgi:hypothetical protein